MSVQPSRQTNIENILETLLSDGGFLCAVVAAKDGLPLAMVGRADTELMAAVAASMRDLAERAHPALTEIITRDAQGGLIVIRYFAVDKDPLLLSISVPFKRAHRRLTNRAIRQIKQIWTK